MELEEILMKLDEFEKGKEIDCTIGLSKLEVIKLNDYIHNLQEIKRICYLVFEKERLV